MNETEQLMTGKDIAEKFLWPNVPNVQNLVDRLGIAGKESSLLEFKASYDPNSDPAKPDGVDYELDVGLWHVVKAIVAFANDVGGCVILGIDDDGRYVPAERGCDPKGVWKEHEGKDIQNHLFSILLKDEYVWHKKGVIHRRVLSQGSLRERLRLVCPKDAFVPCEDNNHKTVAILVAPIPKGDDLIVVDEYQTTNLEAKETIRKTTKCYYRARSVANTEEITIRESEQVTIGKEKQKERILFDHPEKLLTYAAKRHPEQRQFWEIARRGRLIPFKILPNLNKGFVGREHELEDLRSLLIDQGRSVVVHGDGGMGKTELVIQFAHRYVEFFPGGIVFVHAERVQSWQEAMVQLFESGRRDQIQTAWRFKWTKGSEKEDESTRKIRLETNARNALEALGEASETSRVLFIFDNVESCRFLEDSEINKAFPNGAGQLRVLVTVRGLDTFKLNDFSLFSPYPVDPQEALSALDSTSAVKLLESARSGLSGNPILADIATVLEFHPWSLEIAKGQLSEKALSPADYLDSIRRDILSGLGEGETFRNNPNSFAKLLAPTLTRLSPEARRLAQIISMFPAEGVDEYVLRRLWSDYLGVPAKTAQNRDSFTAAMSLLGRYHIISFDVTDEIVRMHRFTRRVLQEDMGDEKQSEADKVSDFLAVWLGFTPFDHDRLRQFAENSLLGQSLLQEVEALRKANDARARGMTQLCQRDAESALIQSRLYYPTDDAPPLEWAQFLEYDEDMVFGRARESGKKAFDPVFLKGIEQVFNQLNTKFRRPHWCYAYLNRGGSRILDAMLGPKSGYWNFFDYLIAVSKGSYSHEYSLPRGTLTPCEWFAAGRIGSSSIVFERLGEEVGNDPGYLSDWTSTDFSKLTGQNWMRFLVGIETPEALERTIVPIDWNKLGPEEWLWLLNSNSKWEPAFSDKFGWNRLVRELCKTERQDGLIHFLNYHLEDYGDKFDWANLPVPTSAQCAGGSDWSGEWADVLSAHPELSDRITPQYLGVSFWVIYSGYNPNLIKDLREVRHPEWRPEVEKILKLALPESDNQ